MRTSALVFGGPSLHGLAPAWLDGVAWRPPAARGDILAAAIAGAEAIGLIDGLFEGSTAVWHKEILYALSSGVRVFGASSMGALRAAECARFGMVGVGAIYWQYATGARVSDADVAVAHAPAELGFLPLTVALVDAEATIAEIRKREFAAGAICERLLAAARALPFKRRTWPDVVSASRLSGADARFAVAAIERRRRNVKREDAALLLSALRNLTHGTGPAPPTSWTFARTVFFETLEKRVASRNATESER